MRRPCGVCVLLFHSYWFMEVFRTREKIAACDFAGLPEGGGTCPPDAEIGGCPNWQMCRDAKYSRHVSRLAPSLRIVRAPPYASRYPLPCPTNLPHSDHA